MDFFIEFIIVILVAIVIEPIVVLICAKCKGLSPFKKAYNKTIEEGTDDNFKMILKSDVKVVYWIGIIFAGFVLILGDVSFTLLYASDKIDTTFFVIMILFYQILDVPAILFCVSCSLKTIYFTENNIVYKTLFLKRKIEIDKIKCAIEQNKKIVIVYNGKSYKISSFFSNYDKALAILKKHNFYKVN